MDFTPLSRIAATTRTDHAGRRLTRRRVTQGHRPARTARHPARHLPRRMAGRRLRARTVTAARSSGLGSRTTSAGIASLGPRAVAGTGAGGGLARSGRAAAPIPTDCRGHCPSHRRSAAGSRQGHGRYSGDVARADPGRRCRSRSSLHAGSGVRRLADPGSRHRRRYRGGSEWVGTARSPWCARDEGSAEGKSAGDDRPVGQLTKLGGRPRRVPAPELAFLARKLAGSVEFRAKKVESGRVRSGDVKWSGQVRSGQVTSTDRVGSGRVRRSERRRATCARFPSRGVA
jgi:hypothetical protein